MSDPPLIAIVDDDSAMREALDDLLQVAGFSARTYTGAAAFLDEHASGRFGLLVTDVRMPGMNGLALLGRLRDMGATLPAIVVTSSADRATQAQAVEAGAIACLAKPIDDRAFLDLVGMLLDRGGRP